MVENRRLGATEQRWFSHWGSGCLAARQLWCRPLCLLHNTAHRHSPAHRVSELLVLYWTEAKCEVNCTCWCWSWTGWSWSCTGSSWSCTGSSCTVYRLEAKQRCGAHSFGPWGVSTLNTSGQHRSLLFFDIYTYIFQDSATISATRKKEMEVLRLHYVNVERSREKVFPSVTKNILVLKSFIFPHWSEFVSMWTKLPCKSVKQGRPGDAPSHDYCCARIHEPIKLHFEGQVLLQLNCNQSFLNFHWHQLYFL